MLASVAEGVWTHQSEFCESNAVVVQGSSGLLLVDAGILDGELVQLAEDIHDLGQPVIAGFSTHPHWDHLLWHEQLGAAPRYGTATCAAAIQARLSDPQWREFVAGMMPPELVSEVPLDLFGLIEGLPVATAYVPWDGPRVRIIEHGGHAPGHAALLIEDGGVLVAGDMLSDLLIAMLNLNAPDPIEGYLVGLQLLDDVAGLVSAVVPGHGSIGDADAMRARIDQDRAYVQALRDGRAVDDPRVGPAAEHAWVSDVHEDQRQRLATH